MPELDVPQMLGSYLLLREIGQGASAVVFEAHDPRTGDLAAIKLLTTPLMSPDQRAEALAGLEREARALTRAAHPGLVALRAGPCHDDGPGGGLHYLILEYLDGTTLREELAGGRVSPEHVLYFLEPVAEALDALHAAGFVHGDLKPSELVLTRGGAVRLIDLGRSVPIRGRERVGVTPLSPTYAAPELLRGRPAEPAGDLWALGVILYEMLTESVPFAGLTVEDARRRVLHEPPAPLPRGLADVEPVIRCALDKDARQRYPSARALVTDYADAIGVRTCWSHTEETPAPPRLGKLVPGCAPLIGGLALLWAAFARLFR